MHPALHTPGNVQSERDAICFTAGAKGVPFGAGVIHAHLAARRAAPAVVAGISGGALNAAALQRCYHEIAAVKDTDLQTSARWVWFRRYLDLLCNEPLSVVWDGLPDQSDFFADMPPVKDPTPSSFEDGAARSRFEALELAARRELYLYVKAGNWLANLPITVGRIADFFVKRVRAKERYPGVQLLRTLNFWWTTLVSWALLVIVVALGPWFPEYKFSQHGWKRFWYRRPLLGWWTWLAALVTPVIAAAAVAFVFWVFGSQIIGHTRYFFWSCAAVLVAYAGYRLVRPRVHLPRAAHVATSAMSRRIQTITRVASVGGNGKHFSGAARNFMQYVFKNLELEKHIVHDFHLRVRLTRLFGENGVSPSLTDIPLPAVLVTAPLQTVPNSGSTGQFWAKKGAPLVDALMASLAVPGLFSPVGVWGRDRIEGSVGADLDRSLDLVDGGVIRKNPIPALFNYLQHHPDLAESLTSNHNKRRLHVVHSHPSERGKRKPNPAADIVDIGLHALRLQERRDTELEVCQTNFTSRIEEELRKRTSSKSPDVRNIFADEISPATDIAFRNSFSPTTTEIRCVVAHGCRQALQRLYCSELVSIAGTSPTVACESLLKHLSQKQIGAPTRCGGLPELCASCTKELEVPQAPKLPAAIPHLPEKFPLLTGEEPRIIFLASGGVFRGPFHGGMLACLLTTQIRPQMIVGASVGTLMGGALGALLTVPEYSIALTLLGDIIDVFLHVDEKIAFTKTFKSAIRELGIRGRDINLSPARLRKLIKRGTEFDPGFAVTGAPAPLIDAISDLTVIPYKPTAKIAAEFLAGHVTAAMNRLLQQMKQETLARLGIREFVIGISLLEPTARRLLGERLGIDLTQQQPFRNIGFFATTTSLLEESCVVLGRDGLGAPTYDFVQAALASSAFPAIFAPRRESDVFPGTGSTDTLFSDGGMFDNLPFLPAISVLGNVQRQHSAGRSLDSVDFLRRRHSRPDLFIVGSLDVESENDESRDGPFRNLMAIRDRASLLANNVKIRAFEDSSRRIHEQLERLVDPASGYKVPSDKAFVDGIVDAGTLAVFPSDPDHLNPTFAFCRSTGFKEWRVRASIADGCFQTFAKLIESVADTGSVILRRAMHGLIDTGRIPTIEWAPPDPKAEQGACPYFRHSTNTKQSHAEQKLVPRNTPESFKCPFFEAWQQLSACNGSSTPDAAMSALAIFHECTYDKSHKRVKAAVDQSAAHSRPNQPASRQQVKKQVAP